MFEMKDSYILKEKISGCKQYITVYVEHDNEVVAKQCTKCFEMKELSLYGKRKKAFAGVLSACKECHKARGKKYYAENKESVDARIRQYGIDNYEKELERKAKYRRDNPEKNKEYREANREHLLKYAKQWYIDNKEYANEFNKKYFIENKEKILADRKKWYYDNKEHALEVVKRWADNNPEKVKAINKRRRTLKALLPTTISPEQIMLLLEIQEGKCYLSDATENLHLEHFIPISWSAGGTTFENCYYMEGSLNISKHNHNPFEWVQTQPEVYQQRFHDVLVPMLAERNEMTVEAFTAYVYECEATVNEVHENYIKLSKEVDA